MKKAILFTSLVLFILGSSHAQGLKGLLKKAKDSSGIGSILGGDANSLSSDEVAGGLKQALQKGVETGTKKLSATDGFFRDAAIKILMPPEAKKIESTLRSIGMGSQVDAAILSMNRAAEDAAKSAAPIFLNAIKQMTIEDAFGILKNGDTAATHYLRGKTTSPLTEAFKPVIETSLQKVDATKYWNSLITTYNQIPLTKKLNPDLSDYVTQKAMDGIFYQVALQEADIRKNPAARTTDLLKKVFSK